MVRHNFRGSYRAESFLVPLDSELHVVSSSTLPFSGRNRLHGQIRHQSGKAFEALNHFSVQKPTKFDFDGPTTN